MANHGYIKSKNKITKEMVDTALAKINEKFLFGKLNITYSFHPDDPTAWGRHVWMVDYDGNGLYDGRVFWIPNRKPREFEIRHGGGGDFIWWIDLLIRNAVAAECDGIITDDSDDLESKAEDYPSLSYREFKLKQLLKLKWKLSEIREHLEYWNSGAIPVPPEHRVNHKLTRVEHG